MTSESPPFGKPDVPIATPLVRNRRPSMRVLTLLGSPGDWKCPSVPDCALGPGDEGSNRPGSARGGAPRWCRGGDDARSGRAAVGAGALLVRAHCGEGRAPRVVGPGGLRRFRCQYAGVRGDPHGGGMDRHGGRRRRAASPVLPGPFRSCDFDTAQPLPDQGPHGGSRASLVAAQIQALLRIGIPETCARSVFGTMAFWTLAAVAAEGVVQSDVDAAERDARFRDGLNMLAGGVRTVLLDAQRSGVSESDTGTSVAGP